VKTGELVMRRGTCPGRAVAPDLVVELAQKRGGEGVVHCRVGSGLFMMVLRGSGSDENGLSSRLDSMSGSGLP